MYISCVNTVVYLEDWVTGFISKVYFNWTYIITDLRVCLSALEDVFYEWLPFGTEPHSRKSTLWDKLPFGTNCESLRNNHPFALAAIQERPLTVLIKVWILLRGAAAATGQVRLPYLCSRPPLPHSILQNQGKTSLIFLPTTAPLLLVLSFYL